ncbi:SNF2-related protein [Caldivirga sp. MU80]|uniref:SNF2-related protein n=1 Tax=Caldivirga sp. MU80 TaxID=1650354 RepID=UPI00082E43E6|nr:SNF2-related protein [Caldivirga sp. MU80]
MVSLIDILRLAGKDLYKHQLDLVSDVLWLPRPRFLLADDVGLGKTIQALLLVKVLMELNRVNNVLIIVPRSVLNQWSDELDKFEIQHYLIESPDYPLGYRVYLVTLDRAKMVDYMNSLQKMQWDLVIIDEAHKIRLGRERERLVYLCNRANGCILLTATPHTGNENDYRFLTSLVDNVVIRREKRDVEEYEGRRIFPRLNYWIVQVKATREESHALYEILNLLERTNIEDIVRVVVEKRAMSSPLSFLTTLRRVVARGGCGEEELEEGELDSCLSGVAGWRDLMDLASQYSSAADRKFDALKRLLTDRLVGRKVLIFTEYATTAEYLFQRLMGELGNCRLIESSDGYARADCGDFGIMYATSRAREKIDVGAVASNLAESSKTAVFISTDIMSEGVNLQTFNVVVNYEVVWSPTKHVQRVGRIWRFGQKADSVLVIDMVLKTALERDEYTMYLDLLEKLYEISLRALPPQSYGEFEIYEVGEGVYKIMEIGSSVFLRENEVYGALLSARLDELRRKIEAILREREKIRWKPKQDVDRGLRIKLGYPPSADVEPGGGYYIVDLVYLVRDRETNREVEAYRERLLIRLPTPLSKSREVREALVREVEVNWDDVKNDSGEVREDERSEIEKKVHTELWLDLKNYLEKLQQYLTIGEPGYKIVSIARARVKGGVQTSAKYLGDFEDMVMREVKSSRSRQRTELMAAEYAKEYLLSMGYKMIEGYRSVPRPFDMVVSRNGRLYTVEVKGRWVPQENWSRRYDEVVSFTANEIDWASRFPDRHIVCIVYISEGNLSEVNCVTFEEFQRMWILETVRGLEYKYNAHIKNYEQQSTS